MEMNHHNHAIPDEENFRKLYEASEIGSIQNLKGLIQKDAYILQKVLVSSLNTNQTPLHISVSHGHLEFTRFLLDQKPELVGEVDDTLQRTPLHLASANENIEIVGLLLEKNTGPCFVRDLNGLIPLHYALIRGRIEIIQLLINARPQSVKTKLRNGQTVLHLCVMDNNLEVLKFFIGLVSDDEEFLNSVDNNGNTILDLSLMVRHIELVRYLLSVTTLKPANQIYTMEMDNTSTSEAIKLRSSYNFELQQTKNSQTIGRQQSVESSIEKRKTSSSWKIFNKHHRHNRNWLQEIESTHMLVAIMIATMTFQATINPPGGVLFPEDYTKLYDSNDDLSVALASRSDHSTFYDLFLGANAISFLASMNVILLIICGFPRNRICAWLLKPIMCVAVIFLTISFMMGMVMVNFSTIKQSFFHVQLIICSLIIFLLCLFGIVKFLIGVVKCLVWVFKRLFTAKTNSAPSSTMI